MYTLFLFGDILVIYCVVWAGAGTLRTAALQEITTKLHIERGRVDMGVSADNPNYQELPPSGISIGTPLLPIAGPFGFYLEETSSSTVYAITCAYNSANGSPETDVTRPLDLANSSIREGVLRYERREPSE